MSTAVLLSTQHGAWGGRDITWPEQRGLHHLNAQVSPSPGFTSGLMFINAKIQTGSMSDIGMK